MEKELLVLKDLSLTVNKNTDQEKQILKNINLTINDGDYISVLGTNGSGKSTLFNIIAGNYQASSGHIFHKGKDITNSSVENRTSFMARVFQDPKMGTASRMTVLENLLLAENRGKKRKLKVNKLTDERLAHFKQLTAQMGNGLDSRLNNATETLSGGQRQALSFIMASQTKPELLLLDEHTAALDPKTGSTLMELTNEVITKNNITTLMITHNLADAMKYGNRLIVLNNGKIILDVANEEKQNLKKDDILKYFISY